MRKLIVVAIAVGLSVASLTLLSGCGGGEGAYGVRPRDVITGHWVATEQSDSRTGVRVPTTVAGEISILFTGVGLPVWSGTLTDRNGLLFDLGHGSWSKVDDVYTVTNAAGQSVQFAIADEQLSSSTRKGGSTVYLWWSRT